MSEPRSATDFEDRFSLAPGRGPLLISVPHAGTFVPEGMRSRMTETARRLPDTDWWVDTLYRPLCDNGMGLLVAHDSRFIIDLNRPPDDRPLYPGGGSGLVPLRTFAGEPIYAPGREPDAGEVRQRVAEYWHPYHAALAAELARVRDLHGHAVLLDAHSIASEVPALFAGRLPALNLGTHQGASAAGELIAAAMGALRAAREYSSVRDGRFKGGFITRHYGRPAHGIHALQLELAQRTYMDEPGQRFDEDAAEALREVLRRLLAALLSWVPGHD